MEIEEHYSLLFGIHSPWEISHVELKMQEQRIDIEYTDDESDYLECGTLSPM